MISIILINYNSSQHTFNCIKSIFDNTNPEIEFEIIVVDNASKKADLINLENCLLEFKLVKLIKSSVNTGFAGGNALGISQAKGEYYYILNNDCLFFNDVLNVLSSFLKENQRVACCAPTMLDADKQHTPSFQFQPSVASKWLGNSFLTRLNSDKYPSRKIKHTKPILVPVISGASIFTRASVYKAIGGLDTNFFLYLEEEDYCKRVTDSGYEIYYVPEAVIQHLGGESTTRNLNIEKEYYISLWYYLNKHHNFISRGLIKLRYFLREFLGGITNPTKLKLARFLLQQPKPSQSMRFNKKI